MGCDTYQFVDTVLSLDDPQQCLLFPSRAGNWFAILSGDLLSVFPLISYASGFYTIFVSFVFLITGVFTSFISFFFLFLSGLSLISSVKLIGSPGLFISGFSTSIDNTLFAELIMGLDLLPVVIITFRPALSFGLPFLEGEVFLSTAH